MSAASPSRAEGSAEAARRGSRADARRLQLVAWAARMGAVTAEALALREGDEPAAARARLVAATRAGLLWSSRPLHERPRLYGATRAGIRACGLRGIEPVRIGPGRAEHAIASARAAGALESRYPGRLMGEPELIAAERALGRLVASVRVPPAPGRRGRTHRPDLVLWPGSGQNPEQLPVAVEVELTVKSRERLLCICRALARSRELGGALYLVSPAAATAVARAISEAGAADRLLAVPLERVAPENADPVPSGS